MTENTHIYLVPGFFGFTSLGSYNYFYRVKDTLESFFENEYGVIPKIVHCRTQPTSSLKRRATTILDEIKQADGLDADQIHLVGHSTGGLDIRLIATPDVRLREDQLEKKVGTKIRSVTTISTPHFGTPLASFFNTLQGKHVLQLLTALAINRAGRGAIFLTSKSLSLAAEVDDWLGRKNSFLDTLSQRLLKNISLKKDDPIWDFLEEIKNDQGAIIQLTPEGMHLFNAAVSDRPDVDYRCVITAVKKPKLRELPLKFRRPTAGATASLFWFLYNMTKNEHRHYPYPSPADSYVDFGEMDWPYVLRPTLNDGVCPALSQIYGEVIDAVEADHMDIVGQFHGAGDTPYADWLSSGANFTETEFKRVWHSIAEKIGQTP